MKRFFSYDDQNDFELRDTLAEAKAAAEKAFEYCSDAAAYAGPLDDPRIGWMGHNASHPDMFKCERCGQEHLDTTKIPHLSDCSALTLINAMRRAAAHTAEAERLERIAEQERREAA